MVVGGTRASVRVSARARARVSVSASAGGWVGEYSNAVYLYKK